MGNYLHLHRGQNSCGAYGRAPEKEDEYLNLFVDIQVKILSQKAPLLNKLKDKMKRKISETDLDATTRYELETRLNGMPNHTKVCHGDFNPVMLLLTSRVHRMLLTGHTQHRVTVQPMPQELTSCSVWIIRKSLQKSIWSFTAQRPTQPVNMLTAGFRL